MIPTGTVMNNPRELNRFEGSEDARKFFYLYENVVSKSLPDSKRAKKNMADLSGAAFDFYFDCFTLKKTPRTMV